MNGDWQDLQRASEVPRYEAIAKLINDCPLARPTVLDVGCGEAVLFSYLGQPWHYYTGIEASGEACSLARKNDELRNKVIQIDAEHFPLGGRQWDVVVLSEVLYYCKDPEAVLEKYRDAVAPGGMLIVTIFQKPESWVPPIRRLVGLDGVTNQSCTKLVNQFFYGQKVHRERIERPIGGEWLLWGIR